MKKLLFAPITLLGLSMVGLVLGQSPAPTPTVTYGLAPVWSTPITQHPPKVRKHRHVHAVPTPVPSNGASGKVSSSPINQPKPPAN